MENHPQHSRFLAKAQLLAGTLLLELSAAASAAVTMDLIENGGPNSSPLRIGIGILGSTAMAGSGAATWKQFHKE